MKIIIPLTITALSVALAGGAFAYKSSVTVLNKSGVDYCLQYVKEGVIGNCPYQINNPCTASGMQSVANNTSKTIDIDPVGSLPASDAICMFPVNKPYNVIGGLTLSATAAEGASGSYTLHYASSMTLDKNARAPMLGIGMVATPATDYTEPSNKCTSTSAASYRPGCSLQSITNPSGPQKLTITLTGS